MAIDPTYHGGHNQVQASYALSSQCTSSPPGCLTAKSLISSFSANSNYRRLKSNRSINVSHDNVLRSLAEEKGDKNYQSSFQLAAKLYKSNSDEFKLKKKSGKKSNKKSVLTLPNEPSVLPQSCTVSDMNDTEYMKRISKPKTQKLKKRQSTQKKRPQLPKYNYEYYDRDADYCSQMNVYLDCSSVDVVKNFKGDCQRKTGSCKTKSEDETCPSDVWTVLRNINRFQFHPSPPMSDDSNFEVMPRKKKVLRKKLNRGVYETCRTEQIAYFSNIEVNLPGGASPSGSSQITVIDNQNGFDNIAEELSKTFNVNAFIKPKNDRVKSLKKGKSKRSKNFNLVQPTITKKDSASKDTLVGLKSEVSVKPEEMSKNHNDATVETRKENICTEVEIQTENIYEQKEEVNKSRINPQPRTHNAVKNTRTMSHATIKENIHGHPDVKAPIRIPASRQGPWCGAQARPNNSPERPLTTTPRSVASPASYSLPMAPCNVGASPARSSALAPSKTVAITTGNAFTNAPHKTVVTSVGRTLSMTPSKTVTSRPARQIMATPCKNIANPPALTFSKLQDCPRVPELTEEIIQPFSQSAMRRIVAKLKFPIVILGRDQVSGTFEVEEYDFPQFKGLDEQVWPFMIDWQEKPSKYVGNKAAQHCKNNFKDNTITVTELNPSKFNKREPMRKTIPESKQSVVAKVKPTSRFRDNMLKLLYKKASHQNVVNDSSPVCVQRAVSPHTRYAITNTKKYKTVDAATSSISIAPNTKNAKNPPKALKQRSPSPVMPPTSPSKIMIPPKYRETKPLWGRAKWASDFIENIFKKIKNGTYYTSEIQCKNTKAPLQNRTSDTDDLKQVNDSKEVSIQVSMPLVSEHFTPKITIQKKRELSITLPGFDDVVPQLEIKSMTRNQIAVKHCVTNILLQFDVNVPAEADRALAFKRSASCVPLSVTDSKTKVFKCKTRILNAVLPAELCSIIPKVMMQFVDKDAPLALTLQEEKRNISLCTISENTLPEIQEPIRLSLLPQIEMFPELRRLRNGRFSNNHNSSTEKSGLNENFYIISVNELPYQYGSTEGPLLLRPLINQKDHFVAQPRHTIVLNSTTTPVCPLQSSAPVTNICTALVPYTGNTTIFCDRANTIQIAPVTAFQQFFRTMLKNTSCMSEYFPTIQLRTCYNHVYVNLNLENLHATSTLCINATNNNFEPLYITTSNSLRAIESNGCPERQIEYIKRARTKEINRTETKKPLSNGEINKSKKRGHSTYMTLYKKCKSMSQIAAEKNSTPLSKVTNLDEFFQALGAGKILSSACEGSCGSKIMSSISNLKSYITGITPRQALLVMLLANKKDTSNLVRFRPMILQGIAVNRITRVSELDMEVEVIEKERFKMPEYLDIVPPESTQNNDDLLEELHWIAKTTASDYQKRFDESSEKLLKALLEKRKRLNPSYLRVMARYVGLGLLKPPTNH